MECDEYQRAAMRVLGLVGEAGEIAEKVKKLVRDKNIDSAQLDRDDMAAELGDVLWYTAVLANFLGLPLDDWGITNVSVKSPITILPKAPAEPSPSPPASTRDCTSIANMPPLPVTRLSAAGLQRAVWDPGSFVAEGPPEKGPAAKKGQMGNPGPGNRSGATRLALSLT